MKASEEIKRQIGAEREHHGEREELFQERREKRSERIRAESEKSSEEQSGASSVVKKNIELVENTSREGRQTMAVKYAGRWNSM